MKCRDCDCWAFMGNNQGECCQMERPERLTQFFIRHRVTGPSGLVTSKPGPPPDTKYECEGGLITDADFFCASFEQRRTHE